MANGDVRSLALRAFVTSPGTADWRVEKADGTPLCDIRIRLSAKLHGSRYDVLREGGLLKQGTFTYERWDDETVRAVITGILRGVSPGAEVTVELPPRAGAPRVKASEALEWRDEAALAQWVAALYRHFETACDYAADAMALPGLQGMPPGYRRQGYTAAITEIVRLFARARVLLAIGGVDLPARVEQFAAAPPDSEERDRERNIWLAALRGLAELSGSTLAEVAEKAGVPPYANEGEGEEERAHVITRAAKLDADRAGASKHGRQRRRSRGQRPR
jgi:hypothetical protein